MVSNRDQSSFTEACEEQNKGIMFRNFSLVNISLQPKSGLTFITPCGIKRV